MANICGPETQMMVPFTEIENTDRRNWKPPYILEKSETVTMCQNM